MVKTIYVALLVMVFCTPFAVADDRRTEVRQQVTERCATADCPLPGMAVPASWTDSAEIGDSNDDRGVGEL